MSNIYKYKPETGFDTPERCHIVEILNATEYPECSVSQATVKPQITTQLHNLKNVAERYVIVKGEGAVEVDKEPSIKVTEYDVVVIPAGVSQRITNTGDSDLVFLCVCTPRFQVDCYVNME